MTFKRHMQGADLNALPADIHGKRSAELDGVTVTQVTFDIGAKWSKDLKEYAGTDLCQLPHAALVTSGVLAVSMADGSNQEFPFGNVMRLPPGHDAWSVGDAVCTFVEFSGAIDYYAAADQ